MTIERRANQLYFRNLAFSRRSFLISIRVYFWRLVGELRRRPDEALLRTYSTLAGQRNGSPVRDNRDSYGGRPLALYSKMEAHAFRGALADALAAINSALTKDKNDVEAMNTRIRTTAKYLAKLQKSVNAEGNDAVPTSWQGWGIMLMGVAFCGLIMVPQNVKRGQVWYRTSHLFVMLPTLGLTFSFWRKHLVLARVKYAVYCSAPRTIFFYTMVYYVVMLIVDEEGFIIVNKLTATTMTTFYLLFISLDAADCSKYFRLFVFGFMFLGMVSGLFLASFVWANGECCAAIYICAWS